MAEFVEYDLSEDGWNDGYAEDGYDFSQDLYRNGTVAAENVPKKLFNFIAGAYFIICAHETPDVYLQRGPGNLTLPEISRRSGKVAATLQMPSHQVARSYDFYLISFHYSSTLFWKPVSRRLPQKSKCCRMHSFLLRI